MKITATVTVEVERTDGSYTKTTERRDHICGDNPRFEPAECAKAIEATTAAINRRIDDNSVEGRSEEQQYHAVPGQDNACPTCTGTGDCHQIGCQP